MLAMRERIGLGSLLTTALARPAPQSFNVAQTSRNRTLSASVLGCAPAPLNTFRAVGAHSDAKFHGIPRRLDKPLMRMVDLPARTKSCGKDLSSRTGEFGLSSPMESVDKVPQRCENSICINSNGVNAL